MRIPATTDESGATVHDISAIPEHLREHVEAVVWVGGVLPYEVRFSVDARISELERQLAEAQK